MPQPDSSEIENEEADHFSKRFLRCISCFGIDPRWPATTPSVRQQTKWGGQKPRVRLTMETSLSMVPHFVCTMETCNDFCNNHRFSFNILCPATWGPACCLLWPLQLRQQAFVHELSTGTHLLATLHLLRSSVARVSHTLRGPGLPHLLHTIRVVCTYANHAQITHPASQDSGLT